MKSELKDFLKQQENIKIVCICIYIFLITFTNTAWHTLSEGTMVFTVFKMLRYISYFLLIMFFMIDIVKKQYSKEMLFYILCLMILAFIGMFTGKDKALFFTVFLFAVSCGINSERIIKSSFIIQGGILLVTVVCAFLGLADNSIVDQVRVRYSLGFNWSNLAPILYLFVLLQYIYMRKTKFTVWECLIAEIINIVFYKLTDTKMSFFTISVILIVLFVSKIIPKFKGNIKKLLIVGKKMIILLPIMCAFVACWLPLYNSDSSIWIKLNSILSGRLWQSKNAITRYGFSLFGRFIDVQVFNITNGGTSDQTYFIDSGYLHIAMQSGIIIFVLLLLIYIVSIYKAYKNKDYYMVGIMIVISLFCINDIYFISPFNMFVLYAFCGDDVFKEIPWLQKLSKPLGVVYDSIGNIRAKLLKKDH